MKRTCEACGRTIRSNNKKAIPLHLKENKRGVVYRTYVCNARCLRRYNDEDDG